MIFFGHPHSESLKRGKSAFTSPETYTGTAYATKSIIRSIGWDINCYKEFIVVRDADGIPLTDLSKGSIKNSKISEIKLATLESKIPVKIFFVKDMIENWYISGISEDHCTDLRFFQKGILAETTRSDCELIPDAKSILNKYIIPEYQGLVTKQAQIMGETIDFSQARSKSATFDELMNYMDGIFL